MHKTLLQRRHVMEVVVSFMSGEIVGGEGARWQASCHSPAVNYCRFTQLDAADDNGSVALGFADEAHGSFTRRSTLMF